MSFDLKMVFGLLALANFIVASAVGTIIPNFWMAILCIVAMIIPSIVMRYRMRRLESDWNKSGGKEIPPDDSGWLVTV
jgi:uncharacterized membrane protein